MALGDLRFLLGGLEGFEELEELEEAEQLELEVELEVELDVERELEVEHQKEQLLWWQQQGTCLSGDASLLG